MRVLIMRHGEATMNPANDVERTLTEKGKQESVQIAQWLKKQTGKIEYVLVSPYLRAQETLKAIKSVLSSSVRSKSLLELEPDADPKLVSSYLTKLALNGVEQVMIISHLPLVGYLVTELCPQETPPMFATSAIVQISIDPLLGAGKLDWRMEPAKLPNNRMR